MLRLLAGFCYTSGGIFLLITVILAVSGCVSGQQRAFEYDIRLPVSGDVILK